MTEIYFNAQSDNGMLSGGKNSYNCNQFPRGLAGLTKGALAQNMLFRNGRVSTWMP